MKRKKLKILIIAPTNFKVTDQNAINSGSIEQHTYLLAEALANRGHMVTLFATKDAGCPNNVTRHYTFKSSPKNYYNLDANHVFSRDFIQVTSALKLSKKYEYISCHTMSGIAIIELLKSQGVPIVGSTTIHWRTTDKRLNPLLNQYPEHPLVVISRHTSYELMDKNNVMGVVHNGLKIEQWPFKKTKKDYLLFVGKLIPEKGVDLVVKAANRLNMNLIIAGRKMDERYPSFFNEYIKPYLNNKIRYVGEVSGKQKISLFKNAYAFISPGRWAEPFGIVFIESQACGTPVIAWNPGASNDPIIDGKTGFIINAKTDEEAVDEICNKVKDIHLINPVDCRLNIKRNYTIEHTARTYEEVMYKQIKDEKHNSKSKPIYQSDILNISLS